MRKIYRLLLIMAMLPFMALSAHAEDVVLRFTASTQYVDYHEFSSVKVENLTRNWQHELIYPDTVLILHTPHGIEELDAVGDALALAGPNPFKGSTFADLILSEGGNVELKALQIDGKLVARYEGSLPKGTHRITFHANTPQVYLLVANTPQGCLVTKLMNIGYGMGNSIDVNMLAENVDRDFTKSRFIGTFMPGDNMRYTAYDDGVASNAITQHQTHSEDITLQFMVQGTVLPKVRTDNFTNIGATTVTANGEVYSDGGETVTERGFCWSTQPNPTIDDNRVECGSGLGIFSANLTDLTPNTTYYFRAYAINAVGTAYGLEKVLVTFAALPKVVTSNVTDIESYSATANGEVISDGGSEVTERGFCWAAHDNPTINDNFTACGSGLGVFSEIMTNLEPNTVYYVRAYAINSVDIMYGNQKSFETLMPLPEVITNEVTEIESTTATGNGEVLSDGGLAVTERGVCWSTAQYPTINGSHVTSGDGLGMFDAAMTDLSPNTTYYVRAYAINAVGLAYGNEVSFTTEAVLAEVVTDEVTGIGFDVATGNGEVVSDGGLTVTERGVCWSTTQNPTITDSHIASGDGLGVFSADMEDLSSNTTYYVRAYAINGVGVAYGNEVSFTTEAILAEVITNDVTEVGSNTATGNGEVVSDGGMTVTERGVCWSTSQNPTIAGDHAAGGTGLGSFSAAITGLSPNTTYYVRAYATNGVGTAYGNEMTFTTEAVLAEVITNEVTEIGTTSATGNGEVVSDGGMTVTERGICWSTSQNPTISDSHVASGSGLGSFSASMTGLSLNTTYYVRAYAINSVGVAYGDEVSFTTDAVLAEVITNEVTEIGTTTATGNGEVVSDGGATVTERGVCWSTTQNPTISDSHVASGSGLGTFSAAMTELSLNTTYYVRAYAVNSVGVAYGDEMSFTTEAVLAEVITNEVTEIGTTTATGNGEVVSDGGANVTERGICWSTSQNPTINDSHAASGSGLGTFSAAMTGLQPHTSYYVRAYATNSVGTSYGEEKQFTTESAGPEGSTGGLFSVTADKQVYFSQGNLQYQASTDTWRFAESQLDYVGDNTLGTVYENGVKCNNALISPTYTGWIDLFGWGTGNNPTNTSTSNSSYFIFTDWGVNPISNGGNVADMWRTPTKDEWNYLLLTRTTTSGIRYAKAKVNDLAGLIILPDDWSASYYTLSSTNTANAAFTANTVTSADWASAFEAHGAVFLPAAGYRNGTTLVNVGTGADYKSSTPQSQNLQGTNVYGFYFGNSYFGVGVLESYRGHSVRLVCPTMEVVTTEATNVLAKTAKLNGKFYCKNASAITAVGFVYGTSATSLTSNVTATANGHSFSASIANLADGTTYYYKAFATTSDGTYYGEVMQFVTQFDAPDGSTGSLFSVSADKQVYFSNGNLQYQASTDTWRFAEHQWDTIGAYNANISATYTGWIDLFGWGTGNNPTNSSDASANYSTFTDWGDNPISNGGNVAGMWYTLSRNEWEYLIFTRTTTSGIRYAKAMVNGIAGMVILPDDWNTNNYTLNSANNADATFDVNIITASDWASAFETHGAMFLPAAGYRHGSSTDIQYVGSWGCYWSSTPYPTNATLSAYYICILSSINTSEDVSVQFRVNSYAHSVRLACPVMEVVTKEATEIEMTSATLNGKFYCKNASAITTVGFVYGTSATSLSNNVTANANSNSFSASIANLEVGTTYYYKAFVTTADGTYYGDVMQFVTQLDAMDGSTGGLFSVTADKQVYFSQGNLQYQASTDTWRFADNQWDYVGNNNYGTVYENGVKCNNALISSTYTGWIDLFGWGTGNNPTITSLLNSFYSTYTDWGVNPISNGGNVPNRWRTLTMDEWNYLINTRSTVSDVRFAKAKVNNVLGLIILPDDWSTEYYTLNNVNGGNFNSNTITYDNWVNSFEVHGAVFLPAAGYRNNTTVNAVGTNSNASGSYWSSSLIDNDAYNLYFPATYVNAQSEGNRPNGHSVRLACPVMEVVTTEATNVEAIIATLNGKFYCKDASAITAVGFVYGTSADNLTSTVTATANGQSFSATASGLSGGTTYYYKAFVTTADGTYYGEVKQVVTLVAPVGSTGCRFSVATDKKVYFSNGNLQYQASTGTWRFAENQHVFYLANNGNISSTYDGWIDLFGWGTGSSPTKTTTTNSAYPSFVDWGVNPISNGGNAANQWRTLTNDEWDYLLNTRTTNSGIRFAIVKRTINGFTYNGFMILPDNWESTCYAFAHPNENNVINYISEEDWTNILEPNGAVFLPNGGYREGTTVIPQSVTATSGVGAGYYWSSTPSENNPVAYSLKIESYAVSLLTRGRHFGHSVRLVADE